MLDLGPDVRAELGGGGLVAEPHGLGTFLLAELLELRAGLQGSVS